MQKQKGQLQLLQMKNLLGKLRQGLSIFAIFIGVIIVCGILYFLYEEILVRTLSKEVSLACNPVESSDSRITNEHMNNGYIFKVNIAPNPERPFGDKIYDIMLLGKKDSDRNFIVNDSLEIIAAKKSKYKSFRQHAIGGYLDKERVYTFILMFPNTLYIQKGVGFSLPGLDPVLIEKFKSDISKLTTEELDKFESGTFWIEEIINDWQEEGTTAFFLLEIVIFSTLSEQYKCDILDSENQK